MAWGRKKPEPPVSIRRDKVIEAIKTHMDFESAMDRDLRGAEFERIKKAHDDATRGLSKAEVTWMYDAQKRHGY
jgi:hypothetical protein